MSDYSNLSTDEIARELAARGISSTLPPAQPSTVNTDSSSNSKISSTIVDRYIDAYLVANVTVGIGKTIKVAAGVVAVLIFIASILLSNLVANSGSRGSGGGIILFIGGINALIVGFIFYVIGIVVSAQGQILKASLDSAVNGSPFITNERKAKMMSLS